MYKEVDVEFDLEDVLEYIADASETEIDSIRTHITPIANEDSSYDFNVDNLYDREKVIILKQAFEKYNLKELSDKLGVINGSIQ